MNTTLDLSSVVDSIHTAIDQSFMSPLPYEIFLHGSDPYSGQSYQFEITQARFEGEVLEVFCIKLNDWMRVAPSESVSDTHGRCFYHRDDPFDYLESLRCSEGFLF